MSEISILKKLDLFKKSPSFSIKDAERKGISRAMLAYYTRQGKLKRISKGIYRHPKSTLLVDIQWEDMVRILTQIPDGVVCLITALSIYNLTDEISREFWFAIPNSKRAPKIKRAKFIRMRNMTLGLTSKKIGKLSIKIFDQERTIIDAFRYLDKEVAIKALKRFMKNTNDIRKIQLYAKQLRLNITPYLLTVTT
jgi:predicted transcriptional regulator of viral defense system